LGYSHNKGYSATESGYAVGAKGEETNIISKDGVFGIPSQAIKGSYFQVTYPQVAAADVAKTFFIAPFACKVVSATERHVTVAGQAGTLTIEKLVSGKAPGAGDVVLGAAFNLTSTANTPVTKAAVTTAAGTLAAGDALCLKVASGSASSYALGTITVLMEVV
jgi:hypothetical protein